MFSVFPEAKLTVFSSVFFLFNTETGRTLNLYTISPFRKYIFLHTALCAERSSVFRGMQVSYLSRLSTCPFWNTLFHSHGMQQEHGSEKGQLHKTHIQMWHVPLRVLGYLAASIICSPGHKKRHCHPQIYSCRRGLYSRKPHW